MIGKTLGHYQVVEQIGAGGMGEVYRARDSRLGRDVAIKVLPEAFARDAERMARFEREAHLLASLNHHNIAAIYGLEENEGIRCLVLELVEGETLAEHLERGPLPMDEALAAARQVAEALEAAHEKGIIHRDLKPGNIKLTSEGKIKVLDFGLAKALTGDAAQDISNSPTMSEIATRQGVILGTARYMSPEQARGKTVDKRADVWAFGCVLYETLSGKPAFSGETISDTVAAVLKTEPDWSALPSATPAGIRRLLQRCLEKDSKLRLRDIGDAWLQVEEDSGEPSSAEAMTLRPIADKPRWQRILTWTLVGVLLVVLFFVSWGWRQGTRVRPRGVVRFALTLPGDTRLLVADRPSVAISPDGRRIVYVGERDGVTQLYLRDLDQLEATPREGTEKASGPFFSPDGQWIGFFAEGKLKKIPAQAGGSTTLCEAPDSRGASWGPDDRIILAPSFGTGLFRVPATGGTPQALTTLEAKEGERTHRWPEVLPGGKAVMFVIGGTGSPDYYLDAKVAVQSLETGERKLLPIQGTFPRYSPTGHILYASEGGLFAAPFDVSRMEATGPAAPVLETLPVSMPTGAGQYSLSAAGSLVYVPGAAMGGDALLGWVNRTGALQPLSAPARAYMDPHLSPDGKRVAFRVQGSGEGTRSSSIWTYDLSRNILTRLTFEGSTICPLWTPDGRRIVFSSEKDGRTSLMWKLADGSGPEEALLTLGYVALIPDSCSPDGRFLAFTQMDPQTQRDIWILPLEGERKPRPFLQTRFDERRAAFSPDGRWIAYNSDESGQDEVYVQPFPGPGGKWQISTEGGTFPSWSRTGREIFYLSGTNRLMSVPVAAQPAFVPGTPQPLFDAPAFWAGALANAGYAPAADSQRFLFAKIQQATGLSQMVVVLNWSEEIERQLSSSGK